MTMVERAVELRDGAASWADQLVRDRLRSHERAPAPAPALDWTAAARAALWRLFNEAAAQANRALNVAGLDEQLEVTLSDDRCHVALQGDEHGRHITVHTCLRQVGEHLSGGAHVACSATRAAITLVPVVANGGPHWLVRTTSCEFTSTAVTDLLLGVFGDDGLAMGRLLPCFSIGDE